MAINRSTIHSALATAYAQLDAIEAEVKTNAVPTTLGVQTAQASGLITRVQRARAELRGFEDGLHSHAAL